MTEIEELRPIVGARLVRVRRMFHVLGGEVDRAEGGVELMFSTGQVVYGDAAADGESIRLGDQEWRDPFDGRLTAENLAYLAESGKAEAFDVSADVPFRAVVGGRVTDVCEIAGVEGKRIGLVFVLSGEMLVVWVNADETHATVLP